MDLATLGARSLFGCLTFYGMLGDRQIWVFFVFYLCNENFAHALLRACAWGSRLLFISIEKTKLRWCKASL